ncbi:succinate dehydrogenase/fumarate reductase iron-sulfur subunit [Haloarcula nitratireducens]|uniref:Succinate dehydrogenase/fumarate reductase iron-sulfur subunit n=1 Tax=Haloarcula nitratireducens TaxID=2487749 RepID=A0AAW4PHG9_9EURY|nr:succinate dehydrogenase/fumarate reductase iron-sulfur subunit [Halomicroarcula nitratireducens]MBX0297429.1 succinate dehydrogenase/fumarate reductase iron-sulfur subunit [Halomicroarcula nitratireducens]
MTTSNVTVHRYDPEIDDEPTFENYEVPVSEATSVLDTLFHIQEEQKENLSFRFSCRQGVCGSCGMEINGEARLACQTAVSDLDNPDDIRVRPLYNLPVIKDLTVDMDDFFEKFVEIDPSFESESLDETTDTAVIDPDSTERQRIAPRTDCIGCGACFSGCSVAGETYLGPAAINKALTLIEDSRDDKTEERLERLQEQDGVWGCHTQGNCSNVCPKDIPISEGIQYLKREAIKHGVKDALFPSSD